MTRLLCTGDLHLGAGADLGRQPGDRLRDQHDVLEQIASLAAERGIDAILNCGDTFEGPGVTPEQLDVYARFVDACNRASIPIVALTGNGKHDAAMRDVNGVQIFDHIPGIDVCSVPKIVDVGDTSIACLPWVHPGRLVAAHNGGDRDEVNREAAELLVATARGLRALIPDGKSAVLALHGSVSGAALPNGLPVDAVGSVPLLDWDALDGLGFDAVVCGHIHKRQLLGTEDSATCGFYVSSPLPLNFGETGDDHGVWILELGDEVFGGVEYEFVPLESRPLVTIEHDFTGDYDGAPMDLFLPEVPLDGAIVRARYRATAEQARRFDHSLVRLELLAAGAHVVRIEPEIVREDRARVEGVDESLDPLQALDLYIEANAVEPDLAGRMRERMAHYLNLVPA